MKKRRNDRASSGWSEYRYGPRVPVTLAKPVAKPILSPGRRTHILNLVIDRLKVWRLSPFEHEGAIHHGLRQAFCADGYRWSRSDAEAEIIVARALRDMGARRPTWAEGQPEYSIPRENCAWCHRPVPEENLAGGRQHRFCSTDCAKAAFARRAFDESKESESMRRQAYSMIQRSRQDARHCERCGNEFRPRSEGLEQRFCSHVCKIAAQTTEVHPRPCTHCSVVYTPRVATKGLLFCSRACADNYRRRQPIDCPTCGNSFTPKKTGVRFCSIACAKTKLEDRTCPCCSKLFKPRQATTVFCSRPCVDEDKKRRRRKAPPPCISPPVFDDMFRMAA